MGLHGSQIVPLVLGPDAIPVLTDVAQAGREPDLAVLSSVAHAVTRPAADVLAVLVSVLASVEKEQARCTLNSSTQRCPWRRSATGASSGIGAAIARAASAAGARVALLARRPEQLHTLSAEIDGVAVPADITDDEAATAAVNTAAQALGGLETWPDGSLRERYTSRMAEAALDPADVAAAVVHILGLPADVVVPEYAVMSVRQ